MTRHAAAAIVEPKLETRPGEVARPGQLARARVNRSPDEAVAGARRAVERLKDVPAHTGPVDLNARIRVVHGTEEIASTEAGFEPAAQAFAAWIAPQE